MIRATEFLSAFRLEGEAVYLRAFPPKKAQVTPQNGPRKWAVSINQLATDRALQEALIATNQHCGIYFVVNSGGDTDAEITRYTAWFVENDTLSIEEQHKRLDGAPLQPSIRVVTRNSVHAYWLIDGECSESEWRDIQERLIAYFDGDPKIKNPSRVMRVPNFDHIHQNGRGPERQKVTVPTFEPERRHKVAEMREAFPLPAAAAVETQPRSIAGPFEYHDDRNDELIRRLIARGKGNSRGKIDARARCHPGEGEKGVACDPVTGKVWCNREPRCDYFTILRAEGLSDEHLPSREYAQRKQESTQGQSAKLETEPQEVNDSPAWPELDPQALYGLAGDFVTIVEPHTEADSVSMLVQFLAVFGNVIGRSAHFAIEGSRHYTNIFVLIVGATAKGRKGTSLTYAQRIFERVDADHALNCAFTGVSSGEGLISAVRDPTEEKEAIKDKKGGKIIDYQTVIKDQGVTDKRALILETEFASVIARMGREGSSTSAVLRQAWDCARRLKVMTRNNPVTATDAHISIIGHITKQELERNLDRVELANGFANRFLFVCSKRSKCLPLGGRVPESGINALVQEAARAVSHARSVGELSFDEQSRELWFDVYPTLSAGRPGMLGVVTSRSEAYVLRLACLYALLEQRSVISEDHLRAALALWSYCEQSARYIFGDALGDRLADEILGTLRSVLPDGLTKSKIRDLFSRNVDADRINSALRLLSENGLAYSGREKGERGRRVEIWFATQKDAA